LRSGAAWLTSLLRSPVIEAAPQDVSLPILKRLLAEGYDGVVWVCNTAAKDVACRSLNGKTWALADFLSETTHDAPVFSHSHVGCKCMIRLTADEKPDVLVRAFGLVSRGVARPPRAQTKPGTPQTGRPNVGVPRIPGRPGTPGNNKTQPQPQET
jgi:hypothetical protein